MMKTFARVQAINACNYDAQHLYYELAEAEADLYDAKLKIDPRLTGILEGARREF